MRAAAMVCPEEGLCLFCKKLIGYLDDYGPKGCRGRAESPLLVPMYVNFAVRRFPTGV